jgi:hypothetical protein
MKKLVAPLISAAFALADPHMGKEEMAKDKKKEEMKKEGGMDKGGC